MKNLNLTAEIRSLEEKNSHLRQNKKIPAVVYGKKQEPISITLEYSEFLKTFRLSGESTIINLKVGKKDLDVLVHDFQKEPVTGEFIHIDFFAITKGEAVTTHIHLNFIWTSQAVKEGGILEELHKEIEVRCLPANLVDHFDVDLSVLTEIGQNIKAGDLNLWDKYTLITPADEVIVHIGKPKTEVIEDTAPVAPTTEVVWEEKAWE